METTPTLPEPDRLERLVTLVDSAIADRGWHGPHVLIKIEQPPDPECFDLGLKDLPRGSHPVDELLGFDAPETWTAIGVVSYGWASPPDAPGGRASKHPDRTRARVTSIVDRTGREAATTALQDGRVIDDPGESVLADVLRRCLGVPTAPAPPHRQLIDTMWLDLVLRAPADPPMSWHRAQALRPQREPTWDELRAQADGLALWMDEGMFARWLLARFPTLEWLLAEADAKLPATLASRLRAEVEQPPAHFGGNSAP